MSTEKINIKKLQSAVKDIASQYDIELAILFGSQALSRAQNNSDTDIAIKARHTLAPIEIAQIAYTLSVTVPSGKIDIVDLRTAPPLLLRHSAEHGILLYEREKNLVKHYNIYALKRYMQANRLRKMKRESLKKFLTS